MSEAEIAYVAGLLEGEGCFYIGYLGEAAKRYPRFTIQCAMTDEDVIRRLRDIVGAGAIDGPLLPPSWDQNRKPVWRWRLGRKDGALELVALLLPWMCSRRSAKIQTMLDAGEEHPARGTWQHGTRQGYEQGCRCDPCRAVNAERGRVQRARRKAKREAATAPRAVPALP
jgi:hypothetical protein